MAKIVFLSVCFLYAGTGITHPEEALNGAICNVRARPLPLCASTLKQLAYIGIDFTFNMPVYPVLETRSPAHWEEGILFLTRFTQKEKAFQEWLELSTILPKKMLSRDDGKHNLIEMERAAIESGISLKNRTAPQERLRKSRDLLSFSQKWGRENR